MLHHLEHLPIHRRLLSNLAGGLPKGRLHREEPRHHLVLSHFEGLYAHVDVREDHGLSVDEGAHVSEPLERRVSGDHGALHWEALRTGGVLRRNDVAPVPSGATVSLAERPGAQAIRRRRVPRSPGVVVPATVGETPAIREDTWRRLSPQAIQYGARSVAERDARRSTCIVRGTAEAFAASQVELKRVVDGVFARVFGH